MTIIIAQIRECPACHAQFQSWSTVSHNTFDATFYTDGYVKGDMYAEGSALVGCPACQRHFWQGDVPVQGYVSDDESERALPGALDIRDERLMELIREAFWTSDAQEKYVRMRAWWASNDVYRPQSDVLRRMGVPPQEFSLTDEEIANLETLLELLNPNEAEESITRAEVLRELGRFDECLGELKRKFDKSLASAAKTIRQLAVERNPRVEILPTKGSRL
jgi:hypothetical protein